ncbi:MAG: hypothetical protein QNI84_04140 [Henriciella sp.]|nr:hypothetical protein [Henriciella sp.]
MTATHTAPFGFPNTLLTTLRRFGILFMKGCLAIAIVLIAGFVAIATAAAGMALALVAILMRLFGNDRPSPLKTDPKSDPGITLEARKTPRGWTVE